jgi:hypothetical protein
LNEHNEQTDRPAPFMDAGRVFDLIISTEDLPGITQTVSLARVRGADCASWGAKTTMNDGWLRLSDDHLGTTGYDPSHCVVPLTSTISTYDLPGTIPAGGNRA